MSDTYCGCCGRFKADTAAMWCLECEGHVADEGPLQARTYYGQYGEDCPVKKREAKHGSE